MAYNTFKQTKGKREIKFAVFDIETTDNWVTPYALGFYDGENEPIIYRGKDCIFNFLRNVIRHKYRTYKIYAHNGGKFDFNFVLDVVRYLDYPFKLICQGSRIIQLKIYQNKKYLENKESRNSTTLVDSIPLLKSSLDKLTKDFKVEHQKLNFMDKPDEERDYEYLYKLYKQKDKRFDDYLKHDCLGLYEVLDKFIKLIYERGGDVGLTTASTSLKTFKKSFLGSTSLKMCNKNLNDEMRSAYYGGRTEIFRMYAKEDDYSWYDINSLYPSVMAINEFPISPPIVIQNPRKDVYIDTDGITEAIVKAPDNLYVPLLPFRGAKLYFPIGKFRGYWDNSLLTEAKELGYKIEPLKSFSFQTSNIFKNYITTFHKLKTNSESRSASYILAKHLLNNLYGKFAQHQESSMIVRIVSKEQLEKLKDDIESIIDVDYGLYKIKSESKGNHFLPQISIHITALAMLRLFKTLNEIHDKGYNIFYCDTDSVATDYNNLKCGENLGDWAKEDRFTKGYFLLPKTYWIEIVDDKDKIRAKGYINELQSRLSESAFKKALFDEDYKAFKLQSKEVKPLPFKSSFRRFHTFVSTDYVKKSIQSKYDKRLILKDFNTLPLNANKLDLNKPNVKKV